MAVLPRTGSICYSIARLKAADTWKSMLEEFQLRKSLFAKVILSYVPRRAFCTMAKIDTSFKIDDKVQQILL
eukprot:1238451-Rhodomonas_salina.1